MPRHWGEWNPGREFEKPGQSGAKVGPGARGEVSGKLLTLCKPLSVLFDHQEPGGGPGAAVVIVPLPVREEN